jgi:NADH-quinone oxidoreductase subunit C
MLEELKEKFPGAVIEGREEGKEVFLTLDRSALLRIGEYLKSIGYEYPADITAVDDGNNLRMIYRLYSIPRNKYAVVSVPIPRRGAILPTVSSIWLGAEWFEREVFDLFGVNFEGHPDLRRFLLPKDYEGPPPLLKGTA